MKFNKAEKDWILYDVANSAFVLILSATIPVYFRSIAEAQGVSPSDATSMFALNTSIAVILVAILAPILGRVADQMRAKKSLFMGFLLMGILGGLAFTITDHHA